MNDASSQAAVMQFSSVVWMLIISGALGGIGSAIYEIFSGKSITSKEPLNKQSSISNNFIKDTTFFIGRSIIGVIGAFGFFLFGVWIKKINLDSGVENELILLSFGVVSGLFSYSLIPKLGNKFEKQFFKEKIINVEEQVSYVMDASKDAISYTTAITAAETALSRSEYSDSPRAIEQLNTLKKTFPLDRMLHIFLGRLYKGMGDFDNAIIILREYIKNISSDKDCKNSVKFNENRSDAYFNIACYHSLKANSLSKSGSMDSEINRLKKETFDSIKLAIDIWPENRKFVADDPDFNFIKKDKEFTAIIGETD